ncbi:MAG TPA: flavin-dependent oxidoreductase [Beijerinckiaceae bacterium]|nr:flavin-dependent oxidoreductase [Beijerinckiaceae bacterium]
MHIAIVGGGIAGLALALNLERHGISCRVFERAPDIRELGVGITVLPHCMREFAALGLQEEIVDAGIVNVESCFYNRFGQLIYREPRGASAGYAYPEVGVHRGRLHLALYRAVLARLGAKSVATDRTCVSVEQSDTGAVAHFIETNSGKASPSVTADAVIACDGINSAVRKQFYPDEKIAFGGINTWRGVTRRAPILTGRSYLRIGSIKTGKIVVYPIIDDVDGNGAQLINWMAEIEGAGSLRNDWNEAGRLEDFYSIYAGWTFDWLDVAELIRTSEQILEYPMVDKDPVERWTFGRVTFAGDAAHPMYPRGSNGAAQASIDARTLADCLAKSGDAPAALAAYEQARLPVANKIVLTNRASPPDFINIKVEELVGDQPFEDLDKYITQGELRALSEAYKNVAGFSRTDLDATQ